MTGGLSLDNFNKITCTSSQHLNTFSLDNNDNSSSTKGNLEFDYKNLPKKLKEKLNIESNFNIISEDEFDQDILTLMFDRSVKGYSLHSKNNLELELDANLTMVWFYIEKTLDLYNKDILKLEGFQFTFRSLIDILSSTKLSTNHKRSVNSTDGSKGSLRSNSHEKSLNSESGSGTSLKKTISTPHDNNENSRDNSKDVRKDQLPLIIKALLSQLLSTFPTPMFQFTVNGNKLNLGEDTGLDTILESLEKEGQYPRAAYLSLVWFGLDRCRVTLLKSTNANLRLVALTLSLRSASNSNQARDSFQSVLSNCTSDDIYIEAILTYIYLDAWLPVMELENLPLTDKLLTAIYRLTRPELNQFLNKITPQLIEQGNIAGLLVTGIFGEEGSSLLQNYLNRTNDLQSVALLSAITLPFYQNMSLQIEKAAVVQHRTKFINRVIEGYRTLLDRWYSFDLRVEFDTQRYKLLRTFSSQKSNSNLPMASIAVRCNFCNLAVGPTMEDLNSNSYNNVNHSNSSKMRRALTNTNSSLPSLPTKSNSMPGSKAYSSKPTVCPKCGKALPRCALCLLHLGSPLDPAHPTSLNHFLPPPPTSTTNNNYIYRSNTTTNSTSNPTTTNSAVLSPRNRFETLKPSLSAGAAHPSAASSNILTTNTLNGDGIGNGKKEVKQEINRFTHWFTLCTVCRHGGHLHHIEEWFKRNSQCPVVGCSCNCTSF